MTHNKMTHINTETNEIKECNILKNTNIYKHKFEKKFMNE